jgi:two-component system sensor kinase FixL
VAFDESSTAGQVLAAAPYGVVVCSEHGAIVYANRQAESLFGYAPGGLAGRTIEALVPEHARSAHEGRRAAYAEDPRIRPMGAAREISGRRTDGSIFPADIMLSPLHVEGRTYVLAMVRDDTERRTAERRLAQLTTDLAEKNRELEAHARELEAFAFTASHDLQEPLRKIVAFGDRLARRLGDRLEGEAADSLARMLDAAKRMQDLIEDLLEWSRLSRRAPELETVDLDRLVADTLRDLEVAVERSGGRVDVGPLGSVNGDRGRLRTLMQNLIDNALKYRRRDLAPEVRVSADRDEGTLRLSFRDNGIGFDPKYRERIFEIFERLHSRREYEGTGIGLALCRKIAEQHGGSISASSAPGAGSTFVVTLPTRAPARQP